MPVLKSQNGWPANDVTRTQSFKVQGTNRALRLVKGNAGLLLSLVAAWVHKHVEPIEPDAVVDDWGYAERNIRGSSTTLSNHASGTALDYNATQHPLGVAGTWSASQREAINGMLAKLAGTVRWGDNYSGRKDGMHFEINVPPSAYGLGKIAGAVQTMHSLLSATSSPASKNRVDLNAVAYAASGGYFHSGQQAAEDDARTVAEWLRDVRKYVSERDVRVWEQLVRAGDWPAAGAQYAGLIKRFQLLLPRTGLTPDGVVGPKTTAALLSAMAKDNYRVTT